MASIAAAYTSAALVQGAFDIFRGATGPLSGGQLSQVYGGNSTIEGNEYIQYLDSPSSTSQLTYTVQGATGNASYPLYLNRRSVNDVLLAQTSITVTEIAG